MKTIELVPDGYEVPENSFSSFPDGKVKIKGFTWFTLDDKDRPILAAQKDGKLVGRCRLTLLDGEEGPPMSMTLRQMPLVAKSFGIDIKKLPVTPTESQAGLITQYMTNLKTLCNQADKVLDVDVYKGWVNSLPGMSVSPGYYYFRVVDIRGDNNKDEELKPLKSKKDGWLDYFYIDFEIVAGEGGKLSSYNGVRFTESLSYAFMVEGDKLVVQKNKDGSWTAAATRISRFVKIAAPDAFVIHFDPPNIQNILPYMKKNILDENKVLKGTLVKEEKGSKVYLSWPSLEEATGYEQPKRIIETMNVDDRCRHILVEALDKLAGASSVMNGSFEFTEAGVKVAKEYLSPLKKEGLIKHGHLEELTPEEITTILTTLQDKVGKEYKERVVMLGVGFEPVLEEEEDSPF